MHRFSNLYDKVLYMFRTCPLSIIRVSQHCIHAIGICHVSSVGCLLARSGPRKQTANRTCRVLYQIISLAFIIRIYHDARSSECQSNCSSLPTFVAEALSSSLPSKNILKNTKLRFCLLFLYGFETWPLREKHRLRMFENRVLRKIFRPKREEGTGKWRRIHSEELHRQYNSPNVVRLKNSRKM